MNLLIDYTNLEKGTESLKNKDILFGKTLSPFFTTLRVDPSFNITIDKHNHCEPFDNIFDS